MKTQRGVTLIEVAVALIVLGVVAGAATAVVHTYTHAIERAKTAEAQSAIDRQTASDQRAENARMRGAQEATDRIAAERKSNDLKKSDVERMVTNALKNVYAKSPEASAWRDTPVPAAVLASVRDEAGSAAGGHQDRPRPAAGRPDKPDAGASVAGANDKRGPAGFRAPDSIPPR